MLPVLTIGRLSLPTAPFVLILTLYAVLTLAEAGAQALRLDRNHVSRTVGWALAGAFVAARLAFVLRFWSLYVQEPLSIVWPLTSGYEWRIGAAVGLALLLWLARSQRLPLWPLADALTPALVAGVIGISLAEWLGGPGLGSPTTMPWGVRVVDVVRHPVQLYETGPAIATTAVWVWLWRGKSADPGTPFLAALAILAAGRLLTEAWHLTSPTLNGYRLPQLLALTLLLLALTLLGRRAQSKE
jgi:prolipoprotein diacylglyceryltransferase